MNLESKGLEQYESFRKEVLETGTKSVHDKISKNLYPLMSTSIKRANPAVNKMKEMRLNTLIFANACAFVKERQMKLSLLFDYKFHSFPPAISDFGDLYLPGTKSTLISQIVTDCHNAPDGFAEDPAKATLIMDGGRVPYQHPPRKEMTFFNYAELLFKVLTTFFQFYNRIDLVFDIYKADSLKATTREKRGRGTRRHVTKDRKCPSNWPMFLKEDRNKEELNIFLAEQLSVMTFPPGKTLFVTSLEKVKSNSSDTMPDSDHEEADTRMCLHVKDAISKGMTDIKVMSSDTDVVLIFLSIFHLLAAMQSS